MEIKLFAESSWIECVTNRFGCKKVIVSLLLVIWFPLLFFSFLFEKAHGLNFVVNVKFLFTLPLLIYSHPLMNRKFIQVIKFFQKSGIILQEDQKKMEDMVRTSEAMAGSKKSKLTIFVLIYLVTVLLLFYGDDLNDASVYFSNRFSKLWFQFISRPVYWLVLLNFLWHLFIWWRLCYKISKLNLKLWPADGDGVGGLGFFGHSLFAFFLPAISISAATAAGCAHVILKGKLSVFGLEIVFCAILLLILFLFLMPFIFFVPVLFKRKSQAIHSYGLISAVQLLEFEKEWIEQEPKRIGYLEVNDFSALTDFGSEVSRVHSMRILPIKPSDLLRLVLAISVPFLPVFAMKISWSELFAQVIKFIF